MTNEEKIQKSKENSTKKYREHQRKTKDYSEKLKQGRIFFHDNLKYLHFNISGIQIDAGYRQNGDVFEWAYSICSPKDKYSARLGRALIGCQFIEEKNFNDHLTLPGNENVCEFFLIESILHSVRFTSSLMDKQFQIIRTAIKKCGFTVNYEPNFSLSYNPWSINWT